MKDLKVVMMGLGYIGLPTAAVIASEGIISIIYIILFLCRILYIYIGKYQCQYLQRSFL